MTSEEINKFFDTVNEEDFHVWGLKDSGKCIPYIGWYWRNVDFDSPITVGHLMCGSTVRNGVILESGGDWKGFMENNKWGYDEWKASNEESSMIRSLCEEAAATPCNEAFQKLFDYFQTLEKRP